MFQLLVGVGNPGPQYAETRHNIAWLLLDSLPIFANSIWKSKFKGHYAEASHKGQKLYALKPQTYMNVSGESVQPMAAFFKIEPSQILVIHDEVDLPFGHVHFKMGGGLAGHNGLKSIAACLGTDQFARMRVGIGRPVHGSVSDWVLGQFSKEEKVQLPLLFEKLNDPLLTAVVDGVSKVGTYNKKNLLA
ncbi:MAG TPA: aminoacyl-tRNA hydrolase [Bacteriovoracaceae bacterium]|nr:aminoacyl-tRNA hydrolase [Bacteriovoracaceae bacterium]